MWGNKWGGGGGTNIPLPPNQKSGGHMPPCPPLPTPVIYIIIYVCMYMCMCMRVFTYVVFKQDNGTTDGH